jgi:hypothetical protein
MRCRPVILAFAVLSVGVLSMAARSPDIPFKAQMLDVGASETAAVADINRDGRLDIVSGENWFEAPGWTKHKFRELNYTNNYYDNFSDLPIDVDGDGYTDLVRVTWFARKISWWKNPGRPASRRLRPVGKSPTDPQRGAFLGVGIRLGGTVDDQPWTETDINTGFNVEFAMLADMDNDGKAQEVVAQENGTPQSWYEVTQGAWVKHVVSDRSYGHGIGAGDINKDGRNDILTPRGWLEAPADPRAANWTFHADWEALNVPPGPAAPPAASPTPGAAAPPAAPPRVMELGFIHVADVNRDGRNDVITAAGHDYGVYWFEQGENGQWIRRAIDMAWSQGHASTLLDLNGDGREDFVTGKRFMAHNGSDPGEKEPLGVYWYEHRPASAPATPAASAGGQRGRGAGSGGVEWIRHVIDYGGRMGAGMQIPVVDIDGDGDLDIVCPGKSGLFLVENLTKSQPARTNRR